MSAPGALDRVRRSGVARIGATVLVVVALIASGVLFNQRTANLSQTLTAVSSILARTCGTSSFAELERQGLVEECRLAQGGDLVEQVEDVDDLPPETMAPEEVDPDLIKDDPDATPADIAPAPGLDEGQVRSIVSPVVQTAVMDYFEANPLPAATTSGYQRAIRRSVTQYLSDNPPDPGPAPTAAQVQGAVRVALLANPPADGEDGAAGPSGRGVASAEMAGCDVLFTFTDGSATRIGPLCGEDGQDGADPTSAQIADAVAAYCVANGSCRGPAGPPGVVQVEDDCRPSQGDVVLDVNPDYDPATQTVVIRCETGPPPGLLGGAGSR